MDVDLTGLWLPILLSALAVFAASFVAWMLLPHHKPDWTAMPNEDGFLDALKQLAIPPGQYMFPFCTMEDMKDPEKKRKWEQGPYGSLILLGARPNFGKNLGRVLVFNVVVGILVAYVGSVALPRGAGFWKVMQLCGTAAILGYVFGGFPADVFTGKKTRTIVAQAVDGVVYGLLTGLVFAWTWPAVT